MGGARVLLTVWALLLKSPSASTWSNQTVSAVVEVVNESSPLMSRTAPPDETRRGVELPGGAGAPSSPVKGTEEVKRQETPLKFVVAVAMGLVLFSYVGAEVRSRLAQCVSLTPGLMGHASPL